MDSPLAVFLCRRPAWERLPKDRREKRCGGLYWTNAPDKGNRYWKGKHTRSQNPGMVPQRLSRSSDHHGPDDRQQIAGGVANNGVLGLCPAGIEPLQNYEVSISLLRLLLLRRCLRAALRRGGGGRHFAVNCSPSKGPRLAIGVASRRLLVMPKR